MSTAFGATVIELRYFLGEECNLREAYDSGKEVNVVATGVFRR